MYFPQGPGGPMGGRGMGPGPMAYGGPLAGMGGRGMPGMVSDVDAFALACISNSNSLKPHQKFVVCCV